MSNPTTAQTPAITYRLDVWFRHQSDTDQSIRVGWNMSAGAKDSADIAALLAELRAQSYNVQRIDVTRICPKCLGNARIVVKYYKRGPAKYADCGVCAGNGTLEPALQWPVS